MKKRLILIPISFIIMSCSTSKPLLADKGSLRMSVNFPETVSNLKIKQISGTDIDEVLALCESKILNFDNGVFYCLGSDTGDLEVTIK